MLRSSSTRGFQKDGDMYYCNQESLQEAWYPQMALQVTHALFFSLAALDDDFFERDLKERKNAAGKSLSEGSFSNMGALTISSEGPSVPLETLSEASEYARLRGGAAGEESDSKDSDPQEAQSDQDSKLNTLCIAALGLSQSDTKQGGQRR